MANEELKVKNVQLALKTSAELFTEKGIENTTREMLARRTGLSRKSIERYFESKCEWVIQTAEWLGAKLQSEMKIFADGAIESGQYTAAELLKMYMTDVKRMFLKDPRVFIFYSEIKAFIFRNSPDKVHDYARVVNSAGDVMVYFKIFTLGQKDGTVKSHLAPASEANYIYDLLMSFFASMALLYGEDNQLMEEYIDRYITASLNAYCKA